MRPLALNITGLHSFREEQQIDFTKLCQAGVFGIFGPTGSGKSTVLDAITLALYGRVERAERGTQGIINQHQDSAAVHFKFAIGDRVFTAERTYRRNKGGGINLRHCRLLEHTPEEVLVLADKAREMDEQVEEIIGLKVADFTRAVVLPQGKFAEFLTLQDRDRREMLERLFGLEKYGEQLSKKIRNQLAGAKTELEMLERQQGELGDASAQALGQAEENLQQQREMLAQVQKDYTQKQQQLEEFKQLRQWQAELQNWLAKEKTLKDLATDMDKLADKLQQAQRAIQVKPYLEQVHSEQNTLNGVQQQLVKLKAQVEGADQAYEKCQQQYQQWQQQMQEQGQQWQAQSIKLDEVLQQEVKRDELQLKYRDLQQRYKTLAGQSQQLHSLINQLGNQRTQLQQQKTELDAQIEQNNVSTEVQQQLVHRQEAWRVLQESLERLTELQRELADRQRQLTVLEQTNVDLQRRVEDAQRALTDKEQQLTNLPMPALTQQQLNQQREELSDVGLVVHTLKLHQRELDQWQAQRAQQQAALEKLQQQIHHRRQQQATLVAEGQQLTEQLTTLEQQYKQMEQQNLALMLRQQLQADQPCPVCGSKDHPQPATGDQQGLELLQLQLQELQHHIDTYTKEREQLDAQLNIDETLLQKGQQELTNAAQQQQSLADEISKLRQQLGSELAPLTLADIEQVVANRQQQLLELQQHIDTYTKEREQLRQQLEKLQSELHQRQQQAAGLQAQKESLQQQRQTMLDKEQQWQQHVTQRQQVFNEVAAGMTGKEIETAMVEVREKLKLLEQLRKQEKKLTHQLEQTVNDLLGKQQQLQQLQQELEGVATEGRACKGQVEELTSVINQVTGGERASQLKTKIEEKLSNLKNGLATAEQQLEKQRLTKEEVHRNYYATQQHQLQLQQRLTTATAELAKKLAEQQFVTQHQAEQALCSAAEITTMQQQINSYQEEKLLTKEHINQLHVKLAGRSLTDQAWQQFLQDWQTVGEQLEQLKETVAKLTDRLATLKQNHLRWNQLEQQKQRQQHLAGKLQQLVDLFRGNAFVQFIAEEQLLNVVVDASKRLGELTHNKYALELAADGNFVIRDDANGGMRRPVSTLSGGETFVTSLALALALSNQIQLRGQYPLEFFFLDEGFGTLDSELLETVMSSLEKLHSEKMTIGVISHVPELRFRMTRRLMVEPAEKGGHGTKVTVELA